MAAYPPKEESNETLRESDETNSGASGAVVVDQPGRGYQIIGHIPGHPPITYINLQDLEIPLSDILAISDAAGAVKVFSAEIKVGETGHPRAFTTQLQPFSNLDRQRAFVQALLQNIIRDTQEADSLAQAMGTSPSSVQNWVTGIELPTEDEQQQLWERYLARLHVNQKQTAESSVQVHILEEPLTLSTLTTALSALTELSTKCWLIAQGRFADLQQYTQTHDERFVREAGVTVGKISHNSPIDFTVNLSAKNVAEAVTTTIDGIAQARSRLALKELEVLAKAQELEQAAHQAAHEQEMAALERGKQQLALEQQRLDILSQQLELQRKAVEYSLELAGTVVDRLQPGLDPAARAMAMQALLPNILQLQQVTGLAVVLPALPLAQEEKHEETE